MKEDIRIHDYMGELNGWVRADNEDGICFRHSAPNGEYYELQVGLVGSGDFFDAGGWVYLIGERREGHRKISEDLWDDGVSYDRKKFIAAGSVRECLRKVEKIKP